MCIFSGTTRLEAAFYSLCIFLSVIWAIPIWGINDFSSFYGSGQAISEGLNPYATHELTYSVETAWFSGLNHNLNPPTTLPVFEFFAAFDVENIFLIWWFVTFLCGAFLLRYLMTEFGPSMPRVAILWCIGFAAFWDTLHLGQIYMPLALAASIAWMNLRSGARIVLAGVLIGLIAAVKPNFLVWPVVLLLAGHFVAAGAAFVTLLVVILVSLTMYGVEPWLQWVELLAGDEERAVFPTNGSVTGFLARLGLGEFGIWSSLAILSATGLWALLTRPPVMMASAIALLVSLFASPIAWAHYVLLLIPLVLELWERRGLVGRFATMALTVPLVLVVFTPPEPALSRLTVGSLYFWALLAILLLVVRHRSEIDGAGPEITARYPVDSGSSPKTSRTVPARRSVP